MSEDGENGLNPIGCNETTVLEEDDSMTSVSTSMSMGEKESKQVTMEGIEEGVDEIGLYTLYLSEAFWN